MKSREELIKILLCIGINAVAICIAYPFAGDATPLAVLLYLIGFLIAWKLRLTKLILKD